MCLCFTGSFCLHCIVTGGLFCFVFQKKLLQSFRTLFLKTRPVSLCLHNWAILLVTLYRNLLETTVCTCKSKHFSLKWQAVWTQGFFKLSDINILLEWNVFWRLRALDIQHHLILLLGVEWEILPEEEISDVKVKEKIGCYLKVFWDILETG